MKTEITIGIDTDSLGHCSDERLACLWAVAQANPASTDSRDAGEVAEYVGREIIRRFVAQAGLPLWNHQGRHHFLRMLQGLGVWRDEVFVPHARPVDEAKPCSTP